jgi:hypothetical protein
MISHHLCLTAHPRRSRLLLAISSECAGSAGRTYPSSLRWAGPNKHAAARCFSPPSCQVSRWCSSFGTMSSRRKKPSAGEEGLPRCCRSLCCAHRAQVADGEATTHYRCGGGFPDGGLRWVGRCRGAEPDYRRVSADRDCAGRYRPNPNSDRNTDSAADSTTDSTTDGSTDGSTNAPANEPA